MDLNIQCSHHWDCLNTYACLAGKCVKRKCIQDEDCKDKQLICFNKLSCVKALRLGEFYWLSHKPSSGVDFVKVFFIKIASSTYALGLLQTTPQKTSPMLGATLCAVHPTFEKSTLVFNMLQKCLYSLKAFKKVDPKSTPS